MSFNSDFYVAKYPEAATNPLLHYLTLGWKHGLTPNVENTPLTPNELIQMIITSGPNLTEIVAGLSAIQLDYLKQALNFDLGSVLTSLDSSQLAGFMAGWGKDELAYVNGLDTFSLPQVVGKFSPDVLMGLFSTWEGESNLGFLAGIDNFDFRTLRGANPDTAMTYIDQLHPALQNAIYDDFDASCFKWLDGAANFDLAAMLKTNFDFFKQIMLPDETLELFSNLGDKFGAVASGLRLDDLVFLDSANGFELGNFLSTTDNTALAGFMKGWGTNEFAYLSTLPGLNLAGKVEGFNPEQLVSMISGWDDPNTIYFINDLEGSGLGNKLSQMPSNLKTSLAGTVDGGMLAALQGVSGSFDASSIMVGI